jgi:hypothetical protein
MSQPHDPNEQYRPGSPRPQRPEDVAAGQPPARGDYGTRGGPAPGGPGQREQDEWADEPGARPKRLGSLAQAARQKQLNQARWLLIIIGILTLGANAFFAATARQQVDAEIQKEQRKAAAQGMQFIVDQSKVDMVVRMVIIINVVMCLVGALFIVFGIIVKMYPVPITIASLVIYVLAALVFAVLEPESLLRGIIIKIIIVVALISSIKAAIAYERERALEPESA